MTTPQLYLVLEATPAMRDRLDAILAAVAIPSALIKPAAGAERHDLDVTRAMVATLQAAGTAALIEQDAAMARALGADGVHVPLSAVTPGYEDAREIVGGRAIVGVTVGPLRHDAMEAGEAGADYVAFDTAIEAEDDRADALTNTIERIAWWSEIFEVPCVAFGAETIDEIAAIAAAGADFVALTCPAGASAADTVAWLRAGLDAIAQAGEPVA